MNIGLRDLYQEVIIDHNRNPRNSGKLVGANRSAQGFNPLCGDKLTLYLKIADDIILDASFQGCGCAISTASASLMTEHIKGKTLKQTKALFCGFQQLVIENKGESEIDLGKITVLAGVREFPSRVKCATLAWHTLHAALEHQDVPISTE